MTPRSSTSIRPRRPGAADSHLVVDLARAAPDATGAGHPATNSRVPPPSGIAGALEPAPEGGPNTAIVDLDRPECLRLLASNSIGRVAVSVTGRDTPMLRPVNYVFDESSKSVLIRSDLGSKLHALLSSATATFEIDGIDFNGHVGWSVIVMGVSEEIANPAELRRIDSLGLEPWAPGHKGHWIRIRANTVSGRRISLISEDKPD